jgi:phage-related protein
MSRTPLKPVVWVGSSYRDLQSFSEDVRRGIGFGLYEAQLGRTPTNAKVLKGFGGTGVLEIREDDSGGANRAVYTVQLSSGVYVLHAFQEKSKQGIKTPKHELDLIRQRLAAAESLHREATP